MVYSFLLYWSQSWTNYQLEKEFTASVESGIYLSKCASRNFTVDIRAMAKSNRWKSRKEYRKYFVENVIKLRFHNIIDIWIIAASTQMLIIQIPKLSKLEFTSQCHIGPYFIKKTMRQSCKEQPMTVPNYTEIEHVRGETLQKRHFFFRIFSLSIEHN